DLDPAAVGACPAPADVGPCRGFEHAIVRHEAHQRVGIVSVEGFGERLQIVNGDAHFAARDASYATIIAPKQGPVCAVLVEAGRTRKRGNSLGGTPSTQRLDGAAA